MDATQGGELIVAKGKDIFARVKKQLGSNLHFKSINQSHAYGMLFCL